MNILLICLLLSMILTILSKLPVGYAQAKQGKYDNTNPRKQQSQLVGFGARALAGHKNAFESLLFFAIANLVVIATNSINHVAEICAIIYLISRVIYHIFYLIDWDKSRSLVWLVGIVAIFTLFAQAL